VPDQDSPLFDTTKPNIARVYDYWLGGKDNFAADREQGDRIEQLYPEIRQVVLENRKFVRNAVTWVAGQGIDQFIDLGAGLPTAENTHQTAYAANSRARVVYVDCDPLVTSHAGALLAGSGVGIVQADLCEPDAVMTRPELRDIIELSKPVALILASVLHFMSAVQAREVVAAYTGYLAPGSYVIISVVTGDEGKFGTGRAAYTAGDLFNHSPGEIAGFFEGLEMVPPGVVLARSWRGGMTEPGPRPNGNAYALAGVAHKDWRDLG
jgi:hypothetical protein